MTVENISRSIISPNILTGNYGIILHKKMLKKEKPKKKPTYLNNSKYWARQAFANSVDPDQMLQNVASDLGLQYLTLHTTF